jgi:hypothetical protein
VSQNNPQLVKALTRKTSKSTNKLKRKLVSLQKRKPPKTITTKLSKKAANTIKR